MAGRVWGHDAGSGWTEMEGAIRTWGVAEGLASDSVTAITQTRDGFLWVGTSAGLARFDGVKFTAVKLAAANGKSAVHVTSLCEDSQGHLWVGSQQGGLFELAGGNARHFTKANGLLDDSVTSLAADTNGLVWIGTKSGLNLADGKQFKSMTTADGLPDAAVSGVHVARSGTVWITTRGGMCRFQEGRIAPYALHTESQGRSPEYLGAYEDRRGNLWAFGDTYLINLAEGKRFNYFRGNEAASVRIWSLCEGSDGRLWIGTSGRGLFCFDDNRFQPVMIGERRWPYDVRAICEDHEGNLWLGTSGGGLVELHPQPVHVLRAGEGLPAGPATSLALDADGRIYVGLARGGLFVGETGRFERFGKGIEVRDFVSSLCVASDGTVWAGTMGQGVYGLRNGRRMQLTTADGLSDDAVRSICVDREGRLWLGTGAGTLHCLKGRGLSLCDLAAVAPGARVHVVVPASSGGVWLGTEDGSIFRSEEGGRVVGVHLAVRAEQRPILALHEGGKGRLWIGTAGDGLLCLAGGVCMSWNTGNGLPGEVVSGVVEDAERNLWLATDAGIYRVNHGAVEKSVSDPQAALACKWVADARTLPEPAAMPGGTRALLAREGKLWFATSDGVLNVDTRRTEPEPPPLPVYIESVAVNGEPPVSTLRSAGWAASLADTAALPRRSDVRSLEVRFTALSFSSPEKIRFRHKLEGFDPDWMEDATSRSVRYGRLPYGNYRFRLAARNPDGGWQEAAATLAFEVPTPLYARPWAMLLYAVTAVALVTTIARVASHRRLRLALTQLEQQQSLERERMRIARDMHDEIGSKLTKISFLSEHARVDAKDAGPLAVKVESIAVAARELLQKMDEIVWVVNPRNDTLEHLADYLGHYATEYFQNTDVECDLRLPRQIPRQSLSSEARHNLFLTFEEALNNVLKHSRATNVKIEMAVHAPGFEIKVTDNGKGFAAAAEPEPGAKRGGRGGNGLRNMRQRMADIGGECDVRSRPGEGTTVSIRIRPGKAQNNQA